MSLGLEQFLECLEGLEGSGGSRGFEGSVGLGESEEFLGSF